MGEVERLGIQRFARQCLWNFDVQNRTCSSLRAPDRYFCPKHQRDKLAKEQAQRIDGKTTLEGFPSL